MATYTGDSGNNTYTGTSGVDTIDGGGGNDTLNGGGGKDTIDGGAGNDVIDGGGGGDILVYRLGENTGATDVYKGGTGIDTLRLELTAAEWSNPVVQQQLALFVAHLASLPRNAAGEVPSGPGYDFTLNIGGAQLTLSAIEKLSIVVDGVVVDHAAPSYRYGDLAGNVTEDTVPGTLVDVGTLDFYDLNWAQTHTVSVSKIAATLGGRLVTTVVNPANGDGQGTVRWEYKLANSLTQSMGAGETATEVFRLTVKDSSGKKFVKDVTVTVTGTNDGPAVSGADTTGAATEDSAAPTLSDSGIIAFDDVDLTDVHTASVTANIANTLGGSLTANVTDTATGAGAGEVVWSYTLVNASAQHLAQGQTAQESFTVTIGDGHGGTVSRVVTVTVTGTNDGPTVSSADITGATTEDSATPTLSDSGNIAFDDIDLSDSHTVSVTANVANALGGSLTASVLDPATGAGGGAVKWTYTLDNAGAQQLAQGQTALESFTVTIGDGHGGTVSQVVNVAVTGTNDAPVLTVDASGGLTEGDGATTLACSGALSFTDADLTDDHSISHSYRGDAAWSGGTLSSAQLALLAAGFSATASGWSYSLGNAEFEFLGAGETITFSFNVAVTDDSGALDDNDTQSVTITLTGSNDGPTALSSLIATNAGTPITGTVGASDVNPGSTLTYAVDVGPSHGSLVLHADGTYEYTPVAGYNGTDSFSFIVDDGLGGISNGTAAIEVAGQGTGQVTYIDDLDWEVDDVVSAPIVNNYVQPEVAALVGGGHVVVWGAYGYGTFNPDGNEYGVYMQRYDSTGQKIGTPELVNLTTNDSQYSAGVAGLADGKYVVTWMSNNQDGSEWGIYCRLYNADGTAATGEVLVNTTTSGQQVEPNVTELAGGGYAITWTGFNADSNSYEIYARVFDAGGAPVGDEFVVNTSMNDSQLTVAFSTESIAGLEGGRFAVVWSDYGAQDGSGSGVYVRVFEADGTAVNPSDVLVNTYTTGDQSNGSVAALGSGFVVTWNSIAQDGSGWGIYAQRFGADGSKLGGEIAVNSLTQSEQVFSKAVELSDGGFVVVWQGISPDGNWDIYGQRFDAAGAQFGNEFIVNSVGAQGDFGFGGQEGPSIALREDGALVVVWRDNTGHMIEQKIVADFDTDTTAVQVSPDDVVSVPIVNNYHPPEVAALAGVGHVVVWAAYGNGSANPDASNHGVYVQRYDGAGQKLGTAELVNLTTDNEQYGPSVAGLTDGKYVVTWMSYDEDGSGYNVYCRLYNTDGTAATGEVLVNNASVNDQIEPNVAELAGGGYAITWTGLSADGSIYEVYARVFDAGGAPVADDFVVNASTVGYQTTSGYQTESIAGLAGGRFAVVWTDAGGYDGWGQGVYTRVFEADGTAINVSDVLVNTYTTGDQIYGSVAALGSGFVVTWSSASQDGSGFGIYAQRFSADGAKLGGEIAVNGLAQGDQLHSKAVELSDGGFVVVWQGIDLYGQFDIHGQRFEVSGAQLGSEFTVDNAGWQDTPSIALREDGALVVVWHDSTGNVIGQKIVTDFDTDTTALPVGQDDVVSAPIVNNYHPPEVAALIGGGHVVVWGGYSNGSANPDSSGYGVYLQRYDDAGQKLGTPELVNLTTDSEQYIASVAGLTDGKYVVTWNSYGQDGSEWGIYSRLYNADGSAATGEVLVNTTTTRIQIEPNVAELAGGGYVITWQGYNTGTGNDDIYARAFDAAGAPVADEFVVNASTAGYQVTSGYQTESIAGLEGGRFAVVWTDYSGQDGSDQGVYARVFEADGTAVNAADVLVNTYTASGQLNGSVAALGSGFVVTWTSFAQDGSSSGIYAQRFDVDGATLGGEIAVNTWTSGDQGNSKAIELSDGGFAVVWQGPGPDGQSDIHGQRFDAAGAQLGGEFIVNDAGSQGYSGFGSDAPSVALREDGALVVVWHRGTAEVIEQKIITSFDGGAVVAKDLTGGAGPDSFLGSSLADSLNGDAGNDRLDGLTGADLLTGGSGDDTFVFSTAPGAGNLDTVADFVSGVDRFELHNGVGLFDGLAAGALNASALDILGDATAATAATRLVYDPATGALYYDADGTGAGVASPFATLQNKPPALTAGDFWVGP